MLYFDIANTDSDVIRQEAEIILMASAYERLLDIEAKARAMNEGIGRLLSTYAHVTVQEALQSRPEIMIEPEYDAAQRAWPLHRKWAQEFYHLRNRYTHANDGRVRTWGWHPIEHLVMAAFLFPLAAKLLLQAEGHYTLTEDDEGRLHAIDRLLELQGWGQPAGAYPTNWHRMVRDVISELARARAVRQAVEELKRQGIVPPELQDGEES